jgi:uroporphyrinogen decarboxylase
LENAVLEINTDEMKSLKGLWQDRIDNFQAAKAGIPAYVPIFAQMHDHAAWLTGKSIREYLTNPETFVRSTILASEYYQFEFPMLVYDAYNIEAEALGQRLVYFDNAIPEVDRSDPLIKNPADLNKLRPPDPFRAGRMPFVLEANQIYKEITGVKPNLTYCGPLTLAIQLRGYEQFIADTRENPLFLHQLLKFLTEEVLAPWIKVLRQVVGGSLLVVGVEAWASLPLVTMDILAEFCVPYVKRLQSLCGEVEVPVGGMWGESCLKEPMRFLRLKIELGRGRDLSGFDPDVIKLGPELYKQVALENNVPLRLGVDGHLIREGPLEDLISRIEYYLKVGAPGGRFFMFLNVIPMDTPPQHIHAAVKAVHTLGRYPLNAEAVLPALDECESFTEFKYRTGLN